MDELREVGIQIAELERKKNLAVSKEEYAMPAASSAA